MQNPLQPKRGAWVRFAWAVLFFGAFLLAFLWAVQSGTGQPLRNFHPVENDEIDYYLEIQSAIQRGVASENAGFFGYFAGGEAYVAPRLFYGAHGFFILIPYYLAGLLLGWAPTTPLLANAAMLLAALCVLALCGGGRRGPHAALALCVLFLPLWLYFGTMMMELQLLALAIAQAALLYSYDVRPTRGKRNAFLALGLIGCLFRITNLFFFLPMLCLMARGKPKRWFVLYAALTLAVSGALFFANAAFSAAYPTGFLDGLLARAASGDLRGTAYQLREHIFFNLGNYFTLRDAPHFVYLRYAAFLLPLALLAEAFFAFDRAARRFRRRPRPDGAALGLSLMTLAAIAITIALYDVKDWRDFRVLAPFLLFMSIYAILAWRRFLLSALAAAILCLGFTAQGGLLMHFAAERYEAPARDPLLQHIIYDPTAQSRWDNTLITMVEVDARLDGGIGLMLVFFDDLADGEAPPARYLLLPHAAELAEYELAAQEGARYLYVRRE